MKTIKHIFDGDFGCEETGSQKPTVSVTLVDEDGNESYVTVEDEWLTNNGLDVGDVWPEGVTNQWIENDSFYIRG